jgi:hypothetical protein
MAELSEAADKAGAAKRLAEAAAEDVVEVAKETIARNHVAWMWGGWAVGLSMGLGGGVLASRRYLQTHYEKIAEDEIAQMREHYRKRWAAREKPDLTEFNKGLGRLGYKEEKEPVRPEPPAPGEPNVQHSPDADSETFGNVFQSAKGSIDDWDYEVEKALRQEGGTYVIHRDEVGDTDFETTTLSYYAGDDVLCDANDRIIDNPERLVGTCLEKFGHGSNDRNVVHVRNEALAIDLEVIKSDKTYAEEVHGLKHEIPPRKRIIRYHE